MMQTTRRPLAAAVLCACTAPVLAGDPTGHDPAQGQVLAGTPVHVVMLNRTLRSQIPYRAASIDPAMYSNTFQMPQGMSVGQAAAAGAAGGALASALMNASLEVEAQNQVRPANEILRAGSCRLDHNEALSRAVGDAVRATTWGQSTTITTHTLAPGQAIADLVDKDQARYVLSVSYSMSTDFSAVVTSVRAEAYSPQLAGAARNWAKRPVWSDDLIVVSDRVEIPPKTQSDIDAMLAAEAQRYAAEGIEALVVKANGGDAKARRKVVPLLREHRRRLVDAKAQTWTPAGSAGQRARLWTADGCAPLHQAIASNNRETQQLMADLFRGALPARVTDTKQPLAEPVVGQRLVQAEPVGRYRLTRGGDDVNLAFLYSWLPEEASTSADAGDGDSAGKPAAGR